MSNVSQFSTTAASNNSASPNGFPEGMAPSGLNDSARELMAALAKCYKDQNGTITTGGTTTAYTLTTNNSHAALTDISLFAFQVNAANTGAATLAVDGLTAKSMQLNGAALAAGDLRTNEIVLAVYNPDNDVFDIFKSGLNQDVIKTDTINEQTTASGVTVDGVLLKDNGITASGTINFSSATVSDLGAVTTADINGGTIDGAVIGGSSAAAGSFTTLSASTSITGTLATAAQANVTSLGTLTGLTVGGNISVTGTVDGRDVAADGTKLDGIEAGADVTDATNVAAAGATMNTDTDVSSVSWVVDEDAMTSNLATKVPTQQSVKAYVDSVVVSIGALAVQGTPSAGDIAKFVSAGVIEGETVAVTGLTAGTTQTQGGATAMTASINEFSTVANTNDGGKLPSDTGIGERVMVVNNGANDMQVWPASGDSIDDGATDAADPDSIAAGSSRLYTRQTATKWSSDKAVVANTTTAVASDALANGDTVIINANGTVSAVSGSAEAVGSPAVFESATTTNIASVFDSNAGKVVIAYTDGGNSSYGTAVVGTVSGTSISFGTPVVFENGGTADNISIAFDSTTNKVVIAYRDFANSQHGTAIVGTVSGTSISFGTAVVFASATTTGTAATFDSNAGKVVIAYQNATNQGVAIVGTVSGTSISFGTAVTFATATTTEIKATFDSNANKVVLVFVDNGNSSYGTAIVGTVSGTSISFGTEVVFESASTTYPSPVFETSTNKIVIAYGDEGNSGAGTAIVGTVSGTSISFGSPVIFETGDVGYVSTVYDSNLDKIIIAYHDVGNSTYGTVVTGAVSGTSLSFETPIVFESATTNYVSASFDSAANRVAIAYTDQGNSSYGTGIVYKSLETNLTSENFAGFSDGAYSDTATATVQVVGAVDDAQSGLTPGQKYYVQVDGSLALTEDVISVYAGLAKSSTEIIVKG